MTFSCHCGRIRIEIVTKPDFIHACNCSLCRKSGADWAYFDPSDVSIGGATSHYCREDKGDPSAEIRFCPHCGSTTHFTLTPGVVARFGNSMMGVNMRLADEESLTGTELRYPDGRGWSGEGEFDYVRPPHIIGEA